MPIPTLAAALAIPLLATGEANYQMTLGGEPVGRVRLSLSATPQGWSFTYESEALIRKGPVVARTAARATASLSPSFTLRALEARRSEGGLSLALVSAVERDGGLDVEVRQAAGVARSQRAPRAFPSSIALLLLSTARPCLPVLEETTGRLGEACAEAFGDEVMGTILGEPFRARLRDGRIERLELPNQRAAFVRVAHAPRLASPPDLFGSPLEGAGPLSAAAAWALHTGAPLALPASECQSVEPSPDGATVRWRRAAPSALEPLCPETERDALERVARRASGASHDAWSAARALTKAVYDRIEVKLPSAIEGSPEGVWQSRRGSCRGHVELFLALARRRGVTSRRALGLLAQDGRFWWHAWVQVRVAGRWYDVDPTEGEAPAVAPRILFAAGDAPVEEAASRLLTVGARLRVEPTP
jgi:hypothetical protein